MVGWLFPLLLVVVALELAAFLVGLRGRGHALLGLLNALVAGLMAWQLTHEVPGLDRTGWANVQRQGDAGGLVFVALVMLLLAGAAIWHFVLARLDGPRQPAAFPAVPGAIGAIGSLFIIWLSFIE